MTHRIELEPAYILHRRPYRNTSYVLEVFTENQGRIAVAARSARGPKSRYRGKLELFYPMRMSWSGKYELKNLGIVDFDGQPMLLNDTALICGFYLNELILKLLPHADPHPKLFLYYEKALMSLRGSAEPSSLRGSLRPKQSLEQTLRYFEKKLLDEIGYGLTINPEQINPDAFYQYVPMQGFQLTEQSDLAYQGRCLIGLYQENLQTTRELKDAKRLMRLMIYEQLHGKELQSRVLLY